MMMTKMILFTITITGIMITLVSNSWVSAWMGMELNTMGFLPLIKVHNNPMSKETAMKYFIIQSITSSLMIMSSTLTFNLFSYQFPSHMITLAMMIKIAAAPWHSWLPPIVKQMSWIPLFSMLTLQKIAPMAIITQTNSILIITMTTISSALIGPISMANQTSTKKLMTYSSISHLSWILAILPLNTTSMFMYIMIYTLSNASTMYWLNLYKMNSINKLTTVKGLYKIPFMMNILSIAGFPPFIGFFPKSSILMFMMSNNLSYMLSMILILNSLISLFMYMSLSNPSIINFNNKMKASLTIYPINMSIILPIMSFPILMI